MSVGLLVTARRSLRSLQMPEIIITPMKRQRRKSPHGLSAKATYRRALQFLTAANRLYVPVRNRSLLHHPIYFLYFHAIELAFKAYIHSYNLAPTRSHRLQELYKQCKKLGLVVGPHDLTNVGNVVTLLDSGNEGHGFRYFNPDSGNLPDLSWTRDMAGQLLRVVVRRMHAIGYTSAVGPPVGIRLVFGKTPKKGKR